MAVNCYKATCRLPLNLGLDLETRLRKTGETFYCPAGHAQHFSPAPDPRDQKILDLERRLGILQRSEERIWDERIALGNRLEDYQAAWLDDARASYPPGVHEAPDGTHIWIAPCGRHGRFIEGTHDHVSGLLNNHVERHECGPRIDIKAEA